MFAINGPSGPMSRNERRVVTDAERKQRAEAQKPQAKLNTERFFTERVALATAKAGASSD